MNNSEHVLMFNSVSEKAVDTYLLPIALITLFITALRAKDGMLHVQSVDITKQLGQQ